MCVTGCWNECWAGLLGWGIEANGLGEEKAERGRRLLDGDEEGAGSERGGEVVGVVVKVGDTEEVGTEMTMELKGGGEKVKLEEVPWGEELWEEEGATLKWER